jgi:beta-1,4-N-acetylglucosaminyltransferase
MNNVLFICGEGGHFEQMKRLINHLEVNDSSLYFIVDRVGLSDKIYKKSKEFFFPALRDKHRFKLLSSIYNFFLHFYISYKIFKKINFSVVISTGPGIAIVPSLVAKLFGVKVIFIETWSRFHTKSYTGRFMYHFSDVFYVQNHELLVLYPNSIYSGRL